MPKRPYFPGLNGIRAFAAISVIVTHVAQSFPPLRPYGYGEQVSLPEALFLDGAASVNLFFVLSAFLIAYLLLHERAHSGVVDIRQFYVRRALRIYPLYYLLVAIGVIVLPLLFGNSYRMTNLSAAQVGGLLLFLPNFVRAGAELQGLNHLWSIGVEEQFYIVIPWIIKRPRLVVTSLLCVVAIRILLDTAMRMSGDMVIRRIWDDARFECMAIGALGAYLYFYRRDLCQVLYAPLAQRGFWTAFALMVLIPMPPTALYNVLASIIFIGVILNISTNPRTLVQLESPTLNYLGSISYGLYMFHFPILYIFMRLLPYWGFWYEPALYVLTIMTTIAIAAFSYRFIETPFLRLKDRIGYRREVTPASASPA